MVEERNMWMMILMSGKWYGRQYIDEEHLRDEINNVFAHVNNGEVVSIADDLWTWCDEMQVDEDDVVIVED